jgi:hypothetical protein
MPPEGCGGPWSFLELRQRFGLSLVSGPPFRGRAVELALQSLLARKGPGVGRDPPVGCCSPRWQGKPIEDWRVLESNQGWVGWPKQPFLDRSSSAALGPVEKPAPVVSSARVFTGMG